MNMGIGGSGKERKTTISTKSATNKKKQLEGRQDKTVVLFQDVPDPT